MKMSLTDPKIQINSNNRATTKNQKLQYFFILTAFKCLRRQKVDKNKNSKLAHRMSKL